MKFSLKSTLIGFAVVGSLIGWMGKLWLENPEMFFQVLSIATTVVPFALAVATIIGLGWRGSQHSAWLMYWGLLLLLTPFVGLATSSLLLPSGQPIRVLSTPRLLGSRLPQQINEPRIWNELEYRMGQGELSKQEVTQALQQLIDFMKTAAPKGWNRPLAWQGRFVGAARQRQLISEDVLADLGEAFYGTQPTLGKIGPVPPGPSTISLGMNYGNPWANQSNLGVNAVWHVRAVSVDGRRVPIRNSHTSFGRNWDAQCKVDLEPGVHEFVVEAEIALIDDSKLVGIDIGTTAPDQWPAALKRWKVAVKAVVKVEPENVEEE